VTSAPGYDKLGAMSTIEDTTRPERGVLGRALERALRLVPMIEAQAEACEAQGSLTATLVDACRNERLFWVAVPKELGGEELDILSQIALFEELSRADGSTGWTLMANAGGTAFAAAGCDDDAVATLFPDRDHLAIVAGMLGPSGRADRVDGGFRLSGHYSFGSGATHATWMAAGASIPDDTDQLVCVIPRDDVTMLGNWDVLGLAGTGSVDYSVTDRFVPVGFTFSRLALAPRRGGPTYRMGIQGVGAAGHAAVALGLAKRALEELVAIVDAGKQRLGAVPVVEQQLFRHDFATQEGRLRAVRAYVFEVFGAAADEVNRGNPMTAEQLARLRQSATVTTQLAYEVVEFAYRWAGSASLRQPHPLGRCMRDMHAATQHAYVDTSSLVNAAGALLDSYRRDEDS
jgi:indole-3-acetate monooxygenase